MSAEDVPPTPVPFERLTFFLAVVMLGPPIGFVVILAIGFVTSMMVHSGLSFPVEAEPFNLGRVVGSIGFVVFGAYVFGFLRAMLHALTMLLVGRARMTRWVYVVLSGLSGGLWAVGLPLLFKLATPSVYQPGITAQWWAGALPFALVGFVPAVVIALLPRFNRWRAP